MKRLVSRGENRSTEMQWQGSIETEELPLPPQKGNNPQFRETSINSSILVSHFHRDEDPTSLHFLPMDVPCFIIFAPPPPFLFRRVPVFCTCKICTGEKLYYQQLTVPGRFAESTTIYNRLPRVNVNGQSRQWNNLYCPAWTADVLLSWWNLSKLTSDRSSHWRASPRPSHSSPRVLKYLALS